MTGSSELVVSATGLPGTHSFAFHHMRRCRACQAASVADRVSRGRTVRRRYMASTFQRAQTWLMTPCHTCRCSRRFRSRLLSALCLQYGRSPKMNEGLNLVRWQSPANVAAWVNARSRGRQKIDHTPHFPARCEATAAATERRSNGVNWLIAAIWFTIVVA